MHWNSKKKKKKDLPKKKVFFPEKLLVFFYSKIVKFCKTDKVKGIPLSKRFIENLLGIKDDGYVKHHSHITGKFIGFAHPYCNRKVRENYFKTPVVANNLFKFDFFFLLKGLRSGVWKTQDTNIGGKNPWNINFASIGNQIHFANRIKYFQQSLEALASSLTDKEKMTSLESVKNF